MPKCYICIQSSVFLDLRGFEVLLLIPIIWRNFDILIVILLSIWYETKQHRYVKVFSCTIILLFITISLLNGSVPLKPTVSILCAAIIFIRNVSDKRRSALGLMPKIL